MSDVPIYPFDWNVLMAVRHEGYGGKFSTLAIAQEPAIKFMLHLPEHFAVAAVRVFEGL